MWLAVPELLGVEGEEVNYTGTLSIYETKPCHTISMDLWMPPPPRSGTLNGAAYQSFDVYCFTEAACAEPMRLMARRAAARGVIFFSDLVDY